MKSLWKSQYTIHTRKPNNTLTNCIQCVFGEYFLKIYRNSHRSGQSYSAKNTSNDKLWYTVSKIFYLNYAYICNYALLNRIFFYTSWCVFCSLQNCAQRTHIECDWSMYSDMLISFRLKIQSLSVLWFLDSLLKQSATIESKWSVGWEYEKYLENWKFFSFRLMKLRR